MADNLNPSDAVLPSRDISGASHTNPLTTRPDLNSRPSYGSGKESAPSVQAEHQPTISPSYDGAGDGQDYLVHRTKSEEGNQNTADPPFHPFFTIIEDAHSSAVHHPTVHYIFSDDDTDIIKEAAYRSLEAQGITIPPEKKGKEYDDDPEASADQEPDEEDKSILPPTIPGVRTHYLLLDVERLPTPTDQITSDLKNLSTSPAGSGTVTSPISPSAANQTAGPHHAASAVPQEQYRVTSVKSFSPTWQILNADLVPAPTFDGQDPNDGPSHGRMLHICGTNGFPNEPRNKDDGLEVLMGRFEKQMNELQAAIDLSKMGEKSTEDADPGHTDSIAGQQGQNEAQPEVFGPPS